MTRLRAVLLGAGGLGCPAALALSEAARDLGLPLALRLVDDDVIERSNLARQLLYTEADVGLPKADVAARRLAHLIAVEPIVARFTPETAPRLLAGCDIVLDGTDNFEARFAANDAALDAGVPLVHGAALGWTGQLFTILPGTTACLRCLFEGPPPSGAVPGCAESGVSGPLCGLVGASMAAEALAFLQGLPLRAASTLVSWKGPGAAERAVAVPRDPACPCALRAAPASKLAPCLLREPACP